MSASMIDHNVTAWTTSTFESLIALEQPTSRIPFIVSCVLAFWALLYISGSFKARRTYFPTVNTPKWSFFQLAAKSEYVSNCMELMSRGSRLFNGPFNLLTDNGSLLMLPPKYIDAVNAQSDLSFNQYAEEYFLSKYDTFRTFRPPPEGLFEEAVLKGLTRSLPRFTKPLSREMKTCLDETWGSPDEWQEVTLMEDVLKWVAQLSSCIFLGERFTKNKEWLRITGTFTMNVFIACAITRFFPVFMRWPVERLMPFTRNVRKDYRRAAAILKPVLAERHQEIDNAAKEGRAPVLPDDSIEWFRSAAHGRDYDEVDIQIALAVAAIHTTSDLITQTLLDLCQHPDVMDALRAEIIDVLGRFGWQKLALTELRLLDSLIKETQRLKPISMASMHRIALNDVKIDDNIQLRKGETLAISSHMMWDAAEYENPSKWDGFRFFNRRKIPGLENKSLLVSTSTNHLGFAHGKHACPGRFFAANEVKIAIVHIVLHYDLKLNNPEHAKWQTYGHNMFPHRGAKISFKVRKPEVDLGVLAMED